MKNSFTPQLDIQVDKPRNLIFCFDGTWNDPTDAFEKGSDITNVRKIYNLATKDDKQKVFYFAGVGTGGSLDKYLGGISGKGADGIRNQAFVKLVTTYQPGDKIFVTGFSRGAAISRMFAQLVDKEGIPERLDFSGKKKRFKTHGEKHPVDIQMLGIFDTVASFGLPSDVAGIPFQQINLFKDLTVAHNVKSVKHLVAIDEGRNTFKPTLCNAADHIEEIWFPGVHADVGGGYSDSGISDIALDYMINQFKKKGVRFDKQKLSEVKPNLTGQVHDKVREDYSLKLVYRVIEVLENNKSSQRRPKIHHTVFERIKRFGLTTPPHIDRLGDSYDLIGPLQEQNA